MKLNYEGIQNRQAWERAGVALPRYDWADMAKRTEKDPVWVHFGAGNIFRGFIAGLQQKLLNEGLADRGILAAETFDGEIIDKIYDPHDSMTLMVTLKADGSTDKEVIASIARGIRAQRTNEAEWARLAAAFGSPSLQMASFTITEKGYALRDMKGELIPVAKADMEEGPEHARHAMSAVAALMLHRYEAGKYPIALVSMDNCSHNGEKLRAAVMEMAQAWVRNGFAPEGFAAYLGDESTVSFPWSMIDKITPRPHEKVKAMLAADGFEDNEYIETAKHTFTAPFVNSEEVQYLVIEDNYTCGRPPLDLGGALYTTRETVDKVETMKVTTCLNPLHTAMSIYGCMLGYTLISAEMADPDLRTFIQKIGYIEAMPVVTDPGVLNPYEFIGTVINRRLPNPFMPDAPQRIAMDTSQKLPIRFGETLKKYIARGLDMDNLVLIPLTLAGYARYLKGIRDDGTPFEPSPDPLLAELQTLVAPLEIGKPDQDWSCLKQLFSRKDVFAVDLYEAGLGERIEGMVRELYAGPGAVRETLHKYVVAR